LDKGELVVLISGTIQDRDALIAFDNVLPEMPRAYHANGEGREVKAYTFGRLLDHFTQYLLTYALNGDLGEMVGLRCLFPSLLSLGGRHNAWVFHGIKIR
jgi:hypothetical protein